MVGVEVIDRTQFLQWMKELDREYGPDVRIQCVSVHRKLIWSFPFKTIQIGKFKKHDGEPFELPGDWKKLYDKCADLVAEDQVNRGRFGKTYWMVRVAMHHPSGGPALRSKHFDVEESTHGHAAT